MAWNNQGGGWQGGGDNRGPWGQGPSGSGGGGGGRQQAPDLEDLLKKGQERLKDIIPGGGGGGGGAGSGGTNKFMFLLIVAGILVALQIQNWNEDRKEQIEETLLKVLEE